MEKNQLVVGLDIGTTKICAIVGRKNEYGKLEILGMGKAISNGVMRGVVVNINKTVESIEKAIHEAEDDAGINIGSVNVGIAGQHIRSITEPGVLMRNSPNDEITREDVDKLTKDMYCMVVPPGDEIIHVMPQTYTVDYQEGILDPVGAAGARLEADFHIITAQTSSIKTIDKCVTRARLKNDSLILEPLASSLAVLGDEEKEAGVCLVDIGGGTTDVAIFHDSIIRHTAVIPFGGNIISEDIKQGCNVMQEQAEQLKTKFGRAIADDALANEIISIPGLRERPPREISLKNLAHIIEARMEEIIELVCDEIAKSGYDERLGAGIVITGGGSQLLGVKQLFEYITGKESRIGVPTEHLGKSDVEVKSPMYATAVGLVLSGFRSLSTGEEVVHAENYDQEKKGLSLISKQGIKGWFEGIVNKTTAMIENDLGESYDSY